MKKYLSLLLGLLLFLETSYAVSVFQGQFFGLHGILTISQKHQFKLFYSPDSLTLEKGRKQTLEGGGMHFCSSQVYGSMIGALELNVDYFHNNFRQNTTTANGAYKDLIRRGWNLGLGIRAGKVVTPNVQTYLTAAVDFSRSFWETSINADVNKAKHRMLFLRYGAGVEAPFDNKVVARLEYFNSKTPVKEKHMYTPGRSVHRTVNGHYIRIAASYKFK